MDVIKSLIERACSNKQRIVLPEGTEERTLKAADKALADGIADLVIIIIAPDTHVIPGVVLMI